MKYSYLKLYFLILSFSLNLDLISGDYNYINGFYGERASGMGGSGVALINDATSSFYNPAGMAFSKFDLSTVNSNNYFKGTINYKDIDGPSRNYSRDNETFSPSFIGFHKKFNRWTYSISYINPNKFDTNSSKRIYSPGNLRKGEFGYTSYTSNEYEYINESLIGGSISKKINNQLSLGISLFYNRLTKRFLNAEDLGLADLSTISYNYSDQKTSNGIMGIFGFLYQFSDRWNFGGSIQRKFSKSGSRSSYESNNDEYFVSSDKLTTGTNFQNTSSSIQTPFSTRFVENYFIRLGLSFFMSSNSLITLDFQHATGYSIKKDSFLYATSTSENYLLIGDQQDQELRRKPVNNIAIGMENYLTYSFVLRFGMFTNNSSQKRINFIDTFVQSRLQDEYEGFIPIGSVDGTNLYIENLPNSHYNFRFNKIPYADDINFRGLTLGLSYFLSPGTSIGFSLIRERGVGRSIFYWENPAVNVFSENSQFIINVSSAN
jgi:hypothetical protein